MSRGFRSLQCTVVAVLLLAVSTLAQSAALDSDALPGRISDPAVQTYSDIYDFTASTLASPQNPGMLAQGRDGNLYGTAPAGGTFGFGGVYKVTPTGTFSVIYNFDGAVHGKTPRGGLTLGTDGNFYGTTVQGGSANYGTVFQITPAGVLTVLHNFSYTDGGNPYAPPIQGTDGSYYGTTAQGGSGSGTIYKITSSGGFTPLYSFDYPHGYFPVAPLVQGTDGSFYGTATAGGTFGDGTVFKITPAGSLTLLYGFDFTHGAGPYAPLVQGSDGNFYGTTSGGGSLDGGVAFKLTPAKILTVLHNFDATPGATDGKFAYAGLLQATDGNFYGATTGGGTQGQGTIYKLTASGSYSTLFNFITATGSGPETTLRQHTSGKFYSAAKTGGVNNLGTLFSFDIGLPPFISVLPTSGKVAKAVGVLGSGFTGTTSVQFNGTSATFNVVSNTYISTSVPSAATTGFVSAVTPTGTLKSNLKFRVTPVILSFTPPSGAVGTPVTITGNSLTGVSKVTFGGVKATVFTVDSNTQITATVPVGAVTGKIQVTTPGGTAVSPTAFTVN